MTGADHNGWYDITITSTGDPQFVRQLAGHIENDRSNTSDPTLAG